MSCYININQYWCCLLVLCLAFLLCCPPIFVLVFERHSQTRSYRNVSEYGLYQWPAADTNTEVVYDSVSQSGRPKTPTHSSIHAFIPTFTYPCIHSPILTHSYTYSTMHTHSPIHTNMHPYTHSPIQTRCGTAVGEVPHIKTLLPKTPKLLRLNQ